MNLEIQYTNLVVDNSDLFECVIDGEHITQNKLGEQINIYAAFDIYNYSPSSSFDIFSSFFLIILSSIKF